MIAESQEKKPKDGPATLGSTETSADSHQEIAWMSAAGASGGADAMVVDFAYIVADVNDSQMGIVLDTREHAGEYAEQQGGSVVTAMDVDTEAASSSALLLTGANSYSIDDADI